MEEILDTVKQLVAGIWRFRWVALLVAWIVGLSGWLLVDQLENKYEANARVYVDSNRVLGPLLKGLAVQQDVSRRVSLMSKTLLSRPNLQKLVRMSDLDLQSKTPEDYEQQLVDLEKNIWLSGSRGNNSIYSITYIDADPKSAKRVVQSLLTVLIEGTIGNERQDSDAAKAFIDTQILDYEQRLVEAEQRLAQFKRKHAGTMPGEAGGFYQRLENASTILRTATLDMREAVNRRDELRRQIALESPSIRKSGAKLTYTPLEAQLRSYQKQMEDLLVKFTDRHPKVMQLREAILELEDKKRQNPELFATRSDQTLQASPVYQDMRTMLAETEARVAQLRVRVLEYEEQKKELQDTVDTIPKVEAELQQLDRDYLILKGQHDQLLSRRESARLSNQVENNVDDIKFRVIDPPFVPSKPTKPDKLLLSAAVLVLALGTGFGLAFLFSLLKPVFHTKKSLAASTGLPVFGTVHQVRNTSQKARVWAGRLTFLSLFGAFFMAFAVVMLLRVSGPELNWGKQIAEANFVNELRDTEFYRKVGESGLVRKIDELAGSLL